MRVWAVCVVTFFGAAELYQWLQGLTLPLPVYGVAGLLLAVASNADRLRWFQSGGSSLAIQPQSSQPEQAHPGLTRSQQDEALLIQSAAARRTGPQLPQFQQTSPASISFTIRSPRSGSENQN